MVKNEKYIVIQGWMVNELKLKGNELMVFAMIYGFSQDGDSEFTGSMKYITGWLGCSKPTAIKTIKSLEEKGLLAKKTTTKNGVQFNSYRAIFTGGKKTLPGVKKFNQGGKETLPNNIVYNIDNILKREEKFKEEVFSLAFGYSQDEVKKFISYWTEKNKSGTKFRAEMEKTWETEKRLKTWMQNAKKFNKSEKRTASEAWRNLIN